MDQLFFLLLILLPIATLSSDLTPYQICEKNFTENNMLQANINNILFDMVAKSSLRGYAISSYAVDGCETVYGVTRCQGDMSVQACSGCITRAAQNIRTTCPDSAKSRIWYEECFLRYDTDDFLGKADKSFADVWESFNAAENPKAFQQAVGELMGEVMAAAAEGRKKFGYGENRVSDKLTVYGMAQCTRDLGESECNACLQNALETMSGNCENQDGCRIFGSSCFIRYEIYEFFSFNATGGAAAPAPSIVIGN
ncbi:hypothetical protein KFK09_003260 [Dendrobium nobile]|uniref:Gnk2-homologous domain-containing protein n=1 Tax=Dendrobium nobile TaxID=94219 RepID=A0A8T3C740_DENNO|nr:hypothetical protein KFK09_003260 [Dendrobium nobile]